MSLIRFQPLSKQFKKNNGFETLFPYHTLFLLIIGYHLGRHLGYIEMLNDARVASLRFFKDNVCTTRINQEKSSRSSQNSPKFCQSGSFLSFLFFGWLWMQRLVWQPTVSAEAQSCLGMVHCACPGVCFSDYVGMMRYSVLRIGQVCGV